jgi:hypothetical protein
MFYDIVVTPVSDCPTVGDERSLILAPGNRPLRERGDPASPVTGM